MNPTFPPDSVPENVVKVGPLFWCVGMGWSTGDVRLWWSRSPHGRWTEFEGNPILTMGTQPWEGSTAYAPCLSTDGERFFLYYSSASAGDVNGSIGLAVATSVVGPYTKHETNPILRYDSGPDWHTGRVSECSVIKDGSSWRMAFMGATAADSHGTEQIGIATASDAAGPWIESPANPVIRLGVGFDSRVAADPSLFIKGGRYGMWYTGGDGIAYRCGLAWADSWDGPWSPEPENPVLELGAPGTFDGRTAFRGSVFQDASTLHVVYAGNDEPHFKGAMRGGNAVLTDIG